MRLVSPIHSTLPYGPSTPRPVKAVVFGLLGGLAAGLGFIHGSDVLDRSLKTVDQAEAHLGLPVLAAVPERASAKKSRSDKGADGAITYRLVAEAPEGPIAESFRNLRASLSLLGPEIERKVFLFTSAAPTEGKSFTNANYALALAQQGHDVLLIDGDLRRPSLRKIFASASTNGSAKKHIPRGGRLSGRRSPASRSRHPRPLSESLCHGSRRWRLALSP